MDENITIKRIKEIKGKMSQEKFAEKINSSQPVISKILNGEAPSINVLISISKEFDVSVDWLLGLSQKKSISHSSKYNSDDPLTYSDIIGFLVTMIKNNSISYWNEEDDSFDSIPFANAHNRKDLFRIKDCFIGDLLLAATGLVASSPETINEWLNTVAKNYDIPLIDWSEEKEFIYETHKGNLSPFEILKMMTNNN